MLLLFVSIICISYGQSLQSVKINHTVKRPLSNLAFSLGNEVFIFFRFSSCSSSVTKNCTYLQNPSYSSSYTTSGSCAFTVTPTSTKICQLRLDFTKFVTTVGTTGACTDSFVVKGPSNSNGLQNLCGTLTGQHGKPTQHTGSIIRIVPPPYYIKEDNPSNAPCRKV